MKPIPFYDEYLKQIIEPRLLAVATTTEYTSIEALRARFIEKHDTAPVSEAVFRQWFVDLNLTMTHRVKVTRLGTDAAPVPEPEPEPLKYAPLGPGVNPPAPSFLPPQRGGIAFPADDLPFGMENYLQ